MNLTTNPKENKVIVLDLEVSPQESMTYGNYYDPTILEAVRYPYIFCFSYCDIKGGNVKVVSLTDFPLYKKDPYNDIEVVKKLYEVISNADCVVAHNVRFDMGRAKARFMFHKLPPLRPVQTRCTLKMARKLADFPSNTLKELALFLGVKHKMETSKHLWQDIHFRQDPKAWKEMKLYNKIDSEVCREIYKILLGWNGRVVNDLYATAVCKGCGSDDVIFRGQTLTKRPGKRFQCKNCYMWGSIYL